MPQWPGKNIAEMEPLLEYGPAILLLYVWLIWQAFDIAVNAIAGDSADQKTAITLTLLFSYLESF